MNFIIQNTMIIIVSAMEMLFSLPVPVLHNFQITAKAFMFRHAIAIAAHICIERMFSRSFANISIPSAATETKSSAMAITCINRTKRLPIPNTSSRLTVQGYGPPEQ